MKRIIWIGPFLSVFLYGTGVIGVEIDAQQPTASQVDSDVMDDALVGWQNDSNPDEGGVQLCGCSACAGKSGLRNRGDRNRCATDRCRKKTRCGQVFGSVEYLNWWSSGQDIPALIAGGNGLPPNPVLFGGREVGDEIQAAVRGTLGYWLDNCKTSALVLRGYGVEGSSVSTSGLSSGNPAFAIPFINDGSNPLLAGQPDSFVLAGAGILQPGVPAGVSAEASNEIFGGDAFYRKLYHQGCGYRIDWLAGYQYSRIDDSVFLGTSTSRIGGPTLATVDLFDAENHFNAGELGMIIECVRGPLTIQLMGKVGLGNMNQQIDIRGSNSTNGTVTGGGIFAQDQSAAGGPTFNIGDFERDEFAWSPELNLTTIWCLRKNVDLTIGYTFIYWSDVLLAGDQIDTRVNRDVLFDGPFIPGGGSNPSFRFNDTDYWAHSFDLGLLFRY